MHYELRTNHLWRTSIDMRDGRIYKAVMTENKGGSARVLVRKRWGFHACSGDVNPHSLLPAAEKAALATAPQDVILSDISHHRAKIPSEAIYLPHTIGIEEKIEALRNLIESAQIQDNPLIDHYYIGYNDYFSADSFEDSEGSHIETEEAATGIIFALMGKNVREGFLIAPRGLEFLSEERILQKLEEKMELLPAEVKLPSPGMYTVVFNPEITGILIHEVIGHGLEADKVLRGESVLAQKMGDSITIEEFSCIDDPLMEDAFGRYTFDNEGVKAEGTPLIEKGVLTSLIHSRETAGALNCESTANALSESVLYPPLVRTSNIQVLPGDQGREELCEGADILVDSLGATELQYEHDFLTLVAESAQYLKEGYSVRNMNIRVDVSELLSCLEGVGKELELVTRHCSKGRQFIPTSTLTPYLRFSNVEVIS